MRPLIAVSWRTALAWLPGLSSTVPSQEATWSEPMIRARGKRAATARAFASASRCAMAAGASRFDLARFGAEVFRPSPRQADVMIVAGTINKKMAGAVKTLYDQMPEPKWVIAMGGCAISGGPFVFPGQYAVVEGVDKLFPVDVYIPGCPPRPEALIEGILKLEEKLTGKRRWPVPPKQ